MQKLDADMQQRRANLAQRQAEMKDQMMREGTHLFSGRRYFNSSHGSVVLTGIINQALWDATRPQWQRAQDAIFFFFGGNVRLYVELLGLDYERFLRELIEEMDSDVENERLTRAQKQTFRAHYERWLYGPTDLFY